MKNNTFDNSECGEGYEGGAIYLDITNAKVSSLITSTSSFIDCKKALFLKSDSSLTLHSSYFKYCNDYSIEWVSENNELNLKYCVFNSNKITSANKKFILDNCYSNVLEDLESYPALHKTSSPQLQFAMIYETYVNKDETESYIDVLDEDTPLLKGTLSSVTSFDELNFEGKHQNADTKETESRMRNTGMFL